jgi:phosphoribosylaminoimidazole carboxylase (NCAIR synthetase)
MSDRLAPGAVIGILGGGQLGRMLSMAAARLGFRCHIYEPGADCPGVPCRMASPRRPTRTPRRSAPSRGPSTS